MVSVKDHKALEERDGLGIVAGLHRAPALVVGNKAVGMDDGGAALTLSNVATEGEGLPERDPTLPGKAALNDGAPQDQDIDPGIAPIGGRVLRHGERSAGCRRSPRLDPGHPGALPTQR